MQGAQGHSAQSQHLTRLLLLLLLLLVVVL
jgi:hypothetical protein